jgi:hypothetical protein
MTEPVRPKGQSIVLTVHKAYGLTLGTASSHDQGSIVSRELSHADISNSGTNRTERSRDFGFKCTFLS